MKIPPKTVITVEADIHASVEKVWDLYTNPEHILKWNNASDDWHTPGAENDLRNGGRFLFRMEARDGSSGFDFTGIYTDVKPLKQIAYTLDDDRNVEVSFVSDGNMTNIRISFEAEQTNPVEMQKEGWQSILFNFKRYVEVSVSKNSMHFGITIKASVERVYKTMLEPETYSEWTSVFNPSSHFIGSWEKGSKILFLGTDSNGIRGGMVSRIRENIPHKFVSIEHLGIVEDEKEIYSGQKVEGWAGALENYTFINNEGSTQLEIDLDVDSDYETYFTETWPKALTRLKSICEK